MDAGQRGLLAETFRKAMTVPPAGHPAAAPCRGWFTCEKAGMPCLTTKTVISRVRQDTPLRR
jgi:hypothetical protein